MEVLVTDLDLLEDEGDLLDEEEGVVRVLLEEGDDDPVYELVSKRIEYTKFKRYVSVRESFLSECMI